MILDSFSLEGKKAVVTGCGTGIGQGMAIALADVGADIVGMGLPVQDNETKAAVEAEREWREGNTAGLKRQGKPCDAISLE